MSGREGGCSASGRKAEVQGRLVVAYGRLKSKDERREFVRSLAEAVGRSREAVYRWCGARAQDCGPPGTVVGLVEVWLVGRGE